MWKETAIKIFIGVSGLAVGALFVIALRGAALSGAEQLHMAQQRTEGVAAALAATPMDDANILAAQALSDARPVR